MRWFWLVIGGLVIFCGAIAFVTPDVLPSLGRSVATPGGLYAAAALRIVSGLALVFSASHSRAPRTLRVIGVVLIIAGLTTPWFGVTRARAVMEWMTGMGPSFFRLVACVAMAIGGLVIYVFWRPAHAQTR